jgi:hypothetical protein
VPLDILLERGDAGTRALTVGGQVCWLAGLLLLGWLVQRRAVRMLVVQGG